MSGLDRLDTALRSVLDRRRDYVLATVLDTSLFDATGPSWVQVDPGGDAVWAVWPDGDEPEVGATVRVIRAGPSSRSWWLALPPSPLPPVVRRCTVGHFWTCALGAASGHWDVLYCDVGLRLNGHPTWQRRARHPAGDGWARYPIVQVCQADLPTGAVVDGTLRLFTWGTAADLSSGSLLYRSDDRGYTWTSCGIIVVDVARGSFFGQMMAVGPSAVYRSTSNGVVWWQVFGAPPDASRWLTTTNGWEETMTAGNDLGPALFDPFVAQPPSGSTSRFEDLRWNGFVALLSTTGLWITTNMFNHYYLPDRVPALLPGFPHDYSWTDRGSDSGHVGLQVRPNLYGHWTPAPSNPVAAPLMGGYTDPGYYFPANAYFARQVFYQDLVDEWVAVGGGNPTLSLTTDIPLDGAVAGDPVFQPDSSGGLVCGTRMYFNFLTLFGDPLALAYDGVTDHPLGRGTVLLRGCAFASPVIAGAVCHVVALAEGAPGPGAPPFLAAPYQVSTTFGVGDATRPVFEDITQNMPTDLGEYYTASLQGITAEVGDPNWYAVNPWV